MFDITVVGENVYYVRKYELHKTQEEFADMLGISKDTVSNIERNAVIPNTRTLVMLATMTDKTMDSFFTKREE